MDYSEYIREVPGANTAVLLIHGIVSSPRCLDWVIPWIPEEYSIYNILLPGHGKTVQDFSHSSSAQWKAATARWMDDICSRYEKVVVVAHSLGTLLSIGEAPNHPQIKAMLLLDVPLKVWVKPIMMYFSLKSVTVGLNEDIPLEADLSHCLGIHLSRNLFLYLGWIPRFLELLQLCRQTRSKIPSICIPCHVFHSRGDELVSLKSAQYFQNHPTIKHQILDGAGHFHQTPEDAAKVRVALESIFYDL